MWGLWTWAPAQTWQRKLWAILLEEYLFCIMETLLAATLMYTLLLKRRRKHLPLALAAYGAQAAGVAIWARLFGTPLHYALLAPLAATVFLDIALLTPLRTLTRHAVTWKGRSYRA